MNVEPIIDARFKRFRTSFELENMEDGSAFERFVNHAILSGHKPDAFGSDEELLDTICVGGRDDMGIDGIGIKLNGLFVRGTKDVDDITDKFKRATVEFIFIQSKLSKKFDLGDFTKFSSGVKDFLSENHLKPRNQKVDQALVVKDYLLSDDVVVLWETNPIVRVYYVSMGKWTDSDHLNAESEQFKKDVGDLPTYGDCHVHFVDAKALKTICDNNENTFSATIEAIDTMSLTASPGVNDSCIVLCYAKEFLKLLTTEEGVIRKSLFDDNVRDYQGPNSVNEEIRETIKGEPEKFGLLNNGITVVCDDYVSSNRRITIKNPQIVNGCQTSHVLFDARQSSADISSVPVQLKLISAKDLDIINQIVRGTNRQNIVLDEAFETTKQFHKDLEQFFDAVAPQYERIYYERRSKQFQHNPLIRQTDKVNLRTLTQSMVGMFLEQPELSHRHESKLLKQFENKLYLDQHSKLSYYTAALMFLTLERLFRSGQFDKRLFYSFRAHLTMVFKRLVSGATPHLNQERRIDEYCGTLLSVLTEPSQTRLYLDRTFELFEQSREKWINELGRSADGIKDITDFTKLLLSACQKADGSDDVEPTETDQDTGRVVKVFVDRNDDFAGFIGRIGQDLFFHSKQCPHLSFDSLEGELVSYRESANRKGWPIAVEVERL